MNTGRPEAGAYYADLYNNAQHELAALREELARKDIVIEDMVESNCDMGQFLAAAEQRNAELVDLLTYFRDEREYPDDYLERLEAAIKPTESGASE